MSVKKIAVFGLVCTVAGFVVGGARASRDAMYDDSRIASAGGAARAQGTNGADVFVTNSSGQLVAALTSDSFGDGLGGLANHNAKDRVVFDVTGSDAGRVYVLNAAGRPSFVMDGSLGVGAASGDVAEMFPASTAIEAGSVVVIDAQHKGAMSVATSAYDRRVAGVVAGANEYKSAITLKSLDGSLGKVPVTLTGTAYCLATSANGAIKAGDLLTTSSVPGHAMKVTDHDAARGAILGKALEDLKGDKGQILILASLQ